MKPRISMITLGVADLPRAVRFYGQGLQLPRMAMDSEEVAFFTLDGTWLALWGREALAQDAGLPVAPSGGFALAHNVGSRSEVGALLAQAVAAGGRLVRPGQDMSWGGHVGYFADPDGHLWEVTWNPHFWPGPPDVPAPPVAPAT